MQNGDPAANRDTIHIALGIHDPTGTYCRHAGAMLASLFSNTACAVQAHIVHNETLTPENARKLQAIARRFGKEIRFYPVRLPAEVHALGGHVTQGALFRLLLPELVQAEKIIYFDCDMVVTLDIRLLWEIDLQERPAAAVLDPGMPRFPAEIRQKVRDVGVSLDAYFNSGMMVLNLTCLRREYHLFQQAIAFLKRYPDAVFHDQDALNFLFQKDYLTLPDKFNKIVTRLGPGEGYQPAVWHYAGVKPWEYYASSLDMLYWKALALTPWQDAVLDGLNAAISKTLAKVDGQMHQDKLAYDALAEKLAQTTELLQKQRSDAPVTANKLRRWVTLFPETENVHLVKDVGMIPYMMQECFGYDSAIACRRNGEYPFLAQANWGLKLEFLNDNVVDSVEAGCEYLEKHAKEIDVLHVFHLQRRTYRWITLYKELNPQGKVYLKLDVVADVVNAKLNDETADILKLCDLISAETKYLYERLNALWPVKVEYIPNGFHDFHAQKPVSWEEKENVICTVGRIGTQPKANEILLEAYKEAFPFISEWKLRLVGPVEPQFAAYRGKYFAQNPHLTDKVQFTGEIVDRNLLEEEYKRARIFCLTSLYESFGIVFAEAIKNGCFVISSPVGAAADITDNGRYGELFAIGDVGALAKLLVSSCKNTDRLKWVCQHVPDFAERNFAWRQICRKIHDCLG